MQKSGITKLPPISVTARDKLLLAKLAEYRLLSTDQIRYLLYPSMNRARKRLVQLFRHALVNRIARPVRLGEGTSQFIYRPSRKGLASLGHSKPALTRPILCLTEGWAEHALRINDFRICFELIGRTCEDVAPVFWRADREVKLSASIVVRNRQMQLPVVPDAFFGLRIQGKELFYMLEVDRGTAPLTRIRKRLEAYLQLWQSRSALAELHIPTFRLLWVTTSDQRLRNLLRVLQSLARTYPRTDVAFLTTLHHVRLEQPEHLLGAVWLRVARAETQPVSPFPLIPFERSRSHQVNHQCAVPDAGASVRHPGPADAASPHLPGAGA